MIGKATSTISGMGLGNFRTLSKSDFIDTAGTPISPSYVFEELAILMKSQL